MTTVDASALVAAAIGSDDRATIALAALGRDDLAAPAFVRAEFTSAIRGESAAGRVDPAAAEEALRWCLALPITLHPAEPFLARMWELRYNVTPYDAWYVALAEALDAPLLTTDARLARSTGVRCEFWVV